jgi:putative chitinase
MMPYQDVMNVILPARGHTAAHVTGHYGEVRAKGPHGGSDFNYEGGQAGVNLQHPAVHSPVSGEVTFVGGQYGTIKIRDADGNSHEILHTQDQVVRVGQRVEVGTEIGHMGGRGPHGASQYAQHVHYQMKDAHGTPVNPEDFWRHRSPGHAAQAHQAAAAEPAKGHHAALRDGDHGAPVEHLQQTLSRLGYRDDHGKPLQADGHFGPRTASAVESFQRAHGLKADGIVGPKTLEALQAQERHGSRLDAPTHPDHAMFRQAQSAVHAIDRQQGREPDHASDRLSAAVTVAAREQGMSRIDTALLNHDGSKAFAVQGDVSSPTKQVAEVNVQQAIHTSIEQSSMQWAKVAEHQAALERSQGHHQVQSQQTPSL